LFCKNIDVDAYNKVELDKLPTKKHSYYASDEGADQWRKFFDKNAQAPSRLDLKVGAQVILLKNLDPKSGLVNGSVGVVHKLFESTVEVKFAAGIFPIETHEWEITQNEFNAVTNTMKKVSLAKRKQLPLRLAWAMTIHKGQGSTLDRAEIDVSEAFAAGQVYVALSRVRNLASLRIKAFNPNKIMVNRKCLNFYKKSEEQKVEAEKFFDLGDE
jgi:ATP-dependent DNA helicase PIF1